MKNEFQHNRKPDLVVVAFCLLVLISCLGTADWQGRKRTKSIICQANLRQWGSLFGAYTDDHDGHFNPG